MDSMQYRRPNSYQEVSNTNHFGYVSDSLGRFAAASQCIASVLNQPELFGLSKSLPCVDVNVFTSRRSRWKVRFRRSLRFHRYPNTKAHNANIGRSSHCHSLLRIWTGSDPTKINVTYSSVKLYVKFLQYNFVNDCKINLLA